MVVMGGAGAGGVKKFSENFCVTSFSLRKSLRSEKSCVTANFFHF